MKSVVASALPQPPAPCRRSALAPRPSHCVGRCIAPRRTALAPAPLYEPVRHRLPTTAVFQAIEVLRSSSHASRSRDTDAISCTWSSTPTATYSTPSLRWPGAPARAALLARRPVVPAATAPRGPCSLRFQPIKRCCRLGLRRDAGERGVDLVSQAFRFDFDMVSQAFRLDFVSVILWKSMVFWCFSPYSVSVFHWRFHGKEGTDWETGWVMVLPSWTISLEAF
jgi:hypothetical protein